MTVMLIILIIRHDANPENQFTYIKHYKTN